MRLEFASAVSRSHALILQKLLGSMTASKFMEDYFLRHPFALPGACGDLVDLGSWPAVERILACPDADVLAARKGQIWDGPRPNCGEDLRKILDAGYTLRIRRAQRHHPGLSQLAQSFERDFASPIDIQVYCTPPCCAGFGWHYDAEDVFVLQTFGSKEWHLRKNTVNPWPLVETLPRDMRYQREIMPLMRCFLETGDWPLQLNSAWQRNC